VIQSATGGNLNHKLFHVSSGHFGRAFSSSLTSLCIISQQKISHFGSVALNLANTNGISAAMPLDQVNLNNILVIIPVLNEEATIAGVIQDLQSYGLCHLRVVDNGSTDQSVAIATQAGAEIIREPIPGYGQACWQGMQNIPSPIEWIFFCDGDGSDDLSELPQFLAQREQFDLILGDRRATPAGQAAMTPTQGFGNQLATHLIALGWKHRYHDLGPLRLIRRSALDKIQMQDRGFGWTVEMQVRAIECGLRICELPVGYRRRLGGRSKISGTLSGSVQAGIVILSTLGKLYSRRWQAPRPKPPPQKLQELWLWLSTILLISGCALTAPHGDFSTVESFNRFGLGITIVGLGFIASWLVQHLSSIWFWAVSIAARLLLLPMQPGDDIWRYLWEGRIQNLGFSPFHFAPSADVLIAYRTDWWSQINHLNVSAIYPPLTQWGFRGLAAISTSVLLFKAGFVLADLLICGLLSHRFGEPKALLYAWNPIVLYSFAGGGHYDSWFILPLVAAWLWFDSSASQPALKSPQRTVMSALLLGISVAIKWMSLPILSFLIWRTLQQRFKWVPVVILCACLPMAIAAFPFCLDGSCPLIPTGSTFVTHGRSAELIPHLLGNIDALRWNNWTYLIPLGSVGLWLILKSQTFGQFAESFFGLLLILSPIVHAWYFTWLAPFAVMSRNWGTRLVSLSAFVYFVLPFRLVTQDDFSWLLSHSERAILWLPYLLGWLWTLKQQMFKAPSVSSAHP
jgi:hypothetical protein